MTERSAKDLNANRKSRKNCGNSREEAAKRQNRLMILTPEETERILSDFDKKREV